MRTHREHPDPVGVWIDFHQHSRSIHRLILALRACAVLIGTGTLAVVIHVMADLPWQGDFLIAIAACLAWAYVFERGEG